MAAARYTRITLALLVMGAALLLLGCEEQVPFRTGRISITSTPSGARVFLDSSDTGRVTPYVAPDVSVGSHSIRLTLAGHADWEQRNVPVSAGQITTVHAPLQPTDQSQGPDVPSELLGLGLKRMDVQAYQSAHVIRADPVSIPSSVDLSVDAPVPGDQGLQGSCVGWAVAYALKTYHERIERGWPLTDDRHVMSPAFVYNQIKVPSGGSYLVDAFILLVNEGVSSLAQMPYDPHDDRSQPSARARAEASNYKIADWGTVLRNTHQVFVQEIKRHLAAGTPVVIGIPVHPDFDSLSESNPVYDDDSGAQRGGHAVVIVGYDDRRSAFKIANSWGTDWGIGGYGWIDYDASEWLIWETYVTEDVVASPGDERPGAASDPQPGSAATSVALNTVLRWTRNTRTTSFDVYLGTDANLGANDFQGSVAQAEFYPHLAPGSKYYWRIDARGAGGITPGPVWTFTTAGTLEEPGKAVNPNPADRATRVARNTELSWDSGGRTTSYDVFLGTAPRLGASELQQTQATRTYYPGGLRAGTRYYWRIDAKNGQGTTPGDVWTFTTVQPREQDTSPVLPSITNKAYLVANYVNERLPAATGGNGTLTYSLSPSVPGLTFEAATRTLYGTAREPGTYHMRYRVQDEDGDTDSQPFTITVVQRDMAPVLPSVSDKTYHAGAAVNERLPAATGGNGTLTYSLSPSVPGLTFEAATRTLYGTARAPGTYHMRYRVQDRDGDTDSQSFTVTVNDVQPTPRSSSNIYWVGDWVGNALDEQTNKIHRSNLDGTNVETVVDTGSVATGITFHNDRMYWTDYYVARVTVDGRVIECRIRRSNPDGSGVETIVSQLSSCDMGIHGGKIYWIEPSSVSRADMDGTNTETILSGLWQLNNIAVGGGRIYWSAYFPLRIQSANLDGTSVETLVVYDDERDSIRDIAIYNGKLYWAYRHRIYRSDLDGSANETFIDDSNIAAMAFHDEKVYWADSTTYSGGGHTKIKRAELVYPTEVETVIRIRNYRTFGIAIYP